MITTKLFLTFTSSLREEKFSENQFKNKMETE